MTRTWLLSLGSCLLAASLFVTPSAYAFVDDFGGYEDECMGEYDPACGNEAGVFDWAKAERNYQECLRKISPTLSEVAKCKKKCACKYTKDKANCQLTAAGAARQACISLADQSFYTCTVGCVAY